MVSVYIYDCHWHSKLDWTIYDVVEMSDIIKQLQNIVDCPEEHLLDELSDIAAAGIARIRELEYLLPFAKGLQAKVDVLEDRIEECQMRGVCKIPPDPPGNK